MVTYCCDEDYCCEGLEMTAKAEDVQAKEAQRQDSKKMTIYEILKSKKAVESKKTFTIGGADGEPVEIEFVFRAISHVEYDKMQAKCPPNTEQRAQGDPFNIEKFSPLLLSKVVVEPELDLKEWETIWSSPAWSRGECAQLFAEAVNVCTRGLDIPFTVSD